MENFDSMPLNSTYYTENQIVSKQKENKTEYFEEMVADIDKVEDLEVLDSIFKKIESEVTSKTEMLKNIQKKNSEMKSDLDSKKNFLSELDSKSCEVQQKTESMQNMIDAQQKKLEYLKNQQIYNLIQFEKDIEKLSELIITAPHEYASHNLKEALVQLEQQLGTKVAELYQIEKVLKDSLHMPRQTEDQLGTALKLHEEDIIALNCSLRNLNLTVENLKKSGKQN